MHTNPPDPRVRTQSRPWYGAARNQRRWFLGGGMSGLLLILFLSLQTLFLSNAAAQTYSSSGGITINSGGPASPYPSTISIPPGTINGNITRVTVTLRGLTHPRPFDLSVLLVGPGGQRTILMSKAGSSFAVNGVNLTFDDSAAASLPNGQITSGTYKPTSYGVVPTFPAPAPAGPHGTALSTFNGTKPNGAWNLYVINPTGSDTGSITGWDLNIATAELSVTMSAAPNPTVVAGANLTYTIGATNGGPDPAANATVTFPLPANTTFVSVGAPAGWSCTTPAVGAAGTVSCTVGTFAVTSVNFNVVVRVAPNLTNGNIDASASITSGTPELNTGNNSASASTGVTVSADLGVSQNNVPNPVTAGTDLTYNFTVVNNGPSDAANVTLGDTLPAGLLFQSANAPAGWTVSTPGVGVNGAVTFSIGVLPAGASANFAIVARVDPAQTASPINNTGTLGTTSPDPNSANNSAATSTNVVTAADWVVGMSESPDPVTAGSSLTYNVSLTNNGPSNIAGPRLTIPIPANTTFGSINGPAGWACSQSGSDAVCDISTFGLSNASFTLVVNVNPTAAESSPNPIPATASVTSTGSTPDPNPGNNTATTNTRVNPAADLAVSQTAVPNPAVAGRTLTYSIVVSNSGPSNATNVTFRNPLPANTTFDSLPTPPMAWNCNTLTPGGGGTLTCTRAAFAAGANDTFTLVVRVNPAAPNGSSLANTASVSAATSDPASANNTSTSSTPVSTEADVSVNQTAAPNPAVAGASLSYSVTVANAGPSNVANPVVTMPIPANTAFQSITPAPGWNCTPPAAGSPAAICTTTSFGVTNATFTLAVLVDPTVPDGANIDSAFSVASTSNPATPDPAGGNNSLTISTPVTTRADMAVTTTAAPNPVSAAANLTYRITVTNNGPSNAVNPALTMPQLADNTTFVSMAAPEGWNCTTPAAGGVGAVNCTGPGSFGVGSVTFTMVVQVRSGTAIGTVLAMTPSVNAGNNDVAISGNDSETVTATVTVEADLSVSLSATPEAVRSGAVLTYTLAPNNSGPELAENVTMNMPIPQNTVFQSVTAPAGWNCTTPAAGGTGDVVCTNPFFDVTTDQIFVAVTVDPGLGVNTSVTASASISSPTEDKNPANNTANLTTPVNVPPTITKQPVNQRVAMRQAATLTVEASGAGPLSYQWYLGSTGDISTPIAGATSNSYTTPAMMTAARYWVRVTGPLGSADSDTAVVVVENYKVLVPLIRK